MCDCFYVRLLLKGAFIMKKLLLLANPVAGVTGIGSHLLEVIDCLVVGGYEVTVETTQHRGHCREIICEKGSNYDTVTVSGGDGTLNEAIGALLSLKSEGKPLPKLGYIPAGTVNDFARSHDIPTNMPKAASIIAKGVSRGCDIGMLGERPFVYVAAFGSFTDTSYSTPQKLKNIFGKLAYIFHGASRLHTILTPHKMKIEYDGGVIEGEFVYGSASNSRSVGGMKLPLKSDVSLDDGKFEIILFEAPSSARKLRKLTEAILTRNADGYAAFQFSTEWLKITSEDDIPWTVDGEFGGSYKNIELRNINRAIEIIVPEECKFFGDAKSV